MGLRMSLLVECLALFLALVREKIGPRGRWFEIVVSECVMDHANESLFVVENIGTGHGSKDAFERALMVAVRL